MSSAAPAAASRWKSDAMLKRVRRRYGAERRFRLIGLFAVGLSVLFLAFLLINMAAKGIGGFVHYEAALPIDFSTSDLFLDPAQLRGADAAQQVAGSDLDSAIMGAATKAYGPAGAEMFGDGAATKLTKAIVADPEILTRKATLWLPVSSNLDIAAKHEGAATDEQLVRFLQSKGALKLAFNGDFLSASDSTDPSSVGVWGALKGSFLTIIVTMGLAFPIGVLAAVYLEEFAPRNRWTDAIEVSINNLAAVPSIIFGLLGLAVFLNVLNLPSTLR